MPHSLLATDGYKFSMGQAGFPLRRETFYFTFRRGGWNYNPFDLKAYVRGLLPQPATPAEYDYLAANNYRLTEAMRQALLGEIEISAIPQGTWFGDQEPILSVTGPSFLVSWLEAQITWLNYPLQLAKLKSLHGIAVSTEHAAIIAALSSQHPKLHVEALAVDHEYPERVLACAQEIVQALDGGEPSLRLIEGGMRAAVCMSHHRMVLEACREVGIQRTSNVHVARELDMVPSGTAGHEHTQRFGSDRAAYVAYMDRVCGLVSCLSDTFSTLGSGLPETIRIARENPSRQFLFRLDSGDREAFLHMAWNTFQREGINNVVINVAGDMDASKITRFEALRKIFDIPPDRLSYMVGGGLTASTLPGKCTRSKVAAVYKLSQSGGQPVMKFSDEPGIGKRSIPGKPVLWRRIRGNNGPWGIIAQDEEPIQEGYIRVSDNPDAPSTIRMTLGNDPLNTTDHSYGLSPETQHLIDQLQQR